MSSKEDIFPVFSGSFSISHLHRFRPKWMSLFIFNTIVPLLACPVQKDWAGQALGLRPVLPPEDPAAPLSRRKGWTMNRYTVGMAMALLLVAGDSLAGQTAARVEYRNGRIGVGVAIGRLPVRVGPHGPAARGWVAADWGPVRIRIASRRPSWTGRTIHRNELRFLLGKETVKRIERHAKAFGIRGPTRGQWFHLDRSTSVLEVTVNRIPVAELYDYRNDGYIDELFLTGPPGNARYGEWGYRRYGDWDDDWDDWDDFRRRYRRPR
jgi:hypothetical protein